MPHSSVKAMKKVIYAASILFLFLCCPTYAQPRQADDDPTYQKYVLGLPSVDKVEVLAVNGFLPKEGEKVDCARPDIICNLSRYPMIILVSKTLSGKDADRLSMLWRSLRRGNGAGCFAPGYVLRFYQSNKLLLAAEVCFQCCNIKLPGAGIASMCGNEQALDRFKGFVTTELPFPGPEDKKENLSPARRHNKGMQRTRKSAPLSR
jgi:hypothetical protein